MKAAIFDMDGTLLESLSIWYDVCGRYLKKIGATPEVVRMDILFKMPLQEAAAKLIQDYNLSCSVEEMLQGWHEILMDFYVNETTPKPHAIDFLTKMKEAGIPMCVTTATDRPYTEAALKKHGMLHFFDKIFTCNEVGKSKYFPDIFETALKYLGTEKKDTVIFEDTTYCIDTVLKADFPLIVVYDSFAKDDFEYNSNRAIRGIKDYSELL